jgi:hypothetical protein
MRRGGGQAQLAPLRRTLLGAGDDGPVAVKPMTAVALGASDVFQLGAAAVNVVPLWVTVAFQPLVRLTPLGTDQVTVHGLTALLPVLVTRTSA